MSTRGTAATIDPLQDERLSNLLASPEFSVPAYLNMALDLSTDTDESIHHNTTDEQHRYLEQQMANLALQLQIRTQSCHDEIGRIGAELQAVLPRCCSDIGRVSTGLDGMEMDLASLIAEDSKNTDGFNKQEDNPLTTLHTLLNLKTHLSSARTILSAASSWDETIRSIPALLAASNIHGSESGDPTAPSASQHLVEAVEALSTLEAGERALRVMPSGREEREEVLATLRSRTEAMLKPQLLHALKKTETRTALLRQCVDMYGSLGKMDVLKEEYVKARPGEVVGIWFSFGGSPPGVSAADEIAEGETKGQDEEVVEDFDFTEDEDVPMTSSTQHSIAAVPKQQFTDFLPDFYESVLELLAKERNQARLVFGAEMAPSVVAKVLVECFKPIASSFGRRLENLCPLPNSHVTSSTGGMESIATSFESTVQFLSLAYDQIEAWGTLSSEAQSSKDGGNRVLLETIREAFLLIASPFAPYQQSLAEVERHPLGEAASAIARDVRSVSSSLQDSSERLGDLAPFMFPLAQVVVDRFELFNSGYNALSTLSEIDSLIANHASELAIAMNSLSGNATSKEFDEQNVHYALEVLRIAGSFKRDLQLFESSVRDRLKSMADQIMDPVLQPNTEIPDAISPTQIRVLLAKEACSLPTSSHVDDGTGVKYPSSVVQLRRLAGISSDSTKNPPILFSKAFDSTSRLARSSQSFVFEVCYAIPERNLRGISALPIWKQDGSSSAEENSYGILPQSFITQVGEHMLALVQALEPFASDSGALGLANEVMTGVREVAVQPWKEFVAAAGCSLSQSDDSKTLNELMIGKALAKYLSDEDETAEDVAHGNEEEEEDPDSAASTAFCNQWLDVVSMAVTGRLLERTMRIPRLGRRGGEHLAADLNYIRNVFTALGVSGHPNPLLQHAAQLASMDEELFRERTSSRDETASGAFEVVHKMQDRMAYVRNISL